MAIRLRAGAASPTGRRLRQYCAARGWSSLCIAATGPLAAHARERGFGTIEFADALKTALGRDPKEGPEARHLRQHLNRARRLGVTVREYGGETPYDARLEALAETACARWRLARHGPQMYLGNPRLFSDRQGWRWFIAERAGSVVGLLSLPLSPGAGISGPGWDDRGRGWTPRRSPCR